MARHIDQKTAMKVAQATHDFLNDDQDLSERLADFVDSISREMGENKPFGQADILAALESAGIVDDVVKKIENEMASLKVTEAQEVLKGQHLLKHSVKAEENSGGGTENKESAKMDTLRQLVSRPGHRVLRVLVEQGRAFLEYDANAAAAGRAANSNTSDAASAAAGGAGHFTVHAAFRDMRFRSQGVPCCLNPLFAEAFDVDLQNPNHTSQATPLHDLVNIEDKISLVVTQESPGSAHVSLVGSCDVEWRKVLAMGTHSMSVEVKAFSVNAGMSGLASAAASVGIFDLRLSLLPGAQAQGELVPLEEIQAQWMEEKQAESVRLQQFYVTSKKWWQDYLAVRPEHSQRLVKIFATNERGVTAPVTSFVSKFKAGRLLESPYHAARFVSLLGQERPEPAASSLRTEVWSAMHTTLCRCKGDVEDHAVLLCSLLLGFGLEAYVTIGSCEGKGAHVWVTTVSHTGSIVFWESLTGQRYEFGRIVTGELEAKDERSFTPAACPFKSVHLLFNHESFYANAQASTVIADGCRFDLSIDTDWRSMDPSALVLVHRLARPTPVLLPPRVDRARDEARLETRLGQLVSSHRRRLKMSYARSESLSYVMSTALFSYELNRVLGADSVAMPEFSSSLDRLIPDGYVFKGFPMQLTHSQPERVFRTLLRSAVGREIVETRGADARFALRCRIYAYPEDLVAVWVMIAVSFKQ